VQHALFGLLTALFALKRPYLALDRRVKRSPHEIGLSATVRAGNRHVVVGLTRVDDVSFCRTPFPV
jgi:hypothetical protein